MLLTLISNRFQFAFACLILVALSQVVGAETTEDEYLPGGPLAGLRLPLLQGAHGEPAGHPGSVPSLAEASDGNQFTPQGQTPMVELYPGSVELWRGYMQKYMPIRSFFDKQSQLKRWTAPNLPGATESESYKAPLYWVARHAYGRSGTPTGLHWPAVQVVRTKVKAPIYQLELGKLPIGMYCVRLVAAVETDYIQPMRLPAFVALKINDQVDGSTSVHRIRISYVEEFYSVAEIYFHAPADRDYKAEIWLDEGSEVDLLVQSILLDDALAGTDRRAIKTKHTLYDPPSDIRPTKYTEQQRLARDEAIWNLYPPINSQGSGFHDRSPASPHISFTSDHVQFGVGNKDEKQIIEEHGKWEMTAFVRRGFSGFAEDLGDTFLTNDKLGLRYSIDDLRTRQPLPDPYPYKDNGDGIVTQLTETAGKRGQFLGPIADGIDYARICYSNAIESGSRSWTKFGHIDYTHDAAVAMVRLAYQFPSIDSANMLPAVLSAPGFRGSDSRFRKRATQAYWQQHYGNYRTLPDHYDRLFSYINGNEKFAASIGRFVPWIKNSRDVIKLLDVYLVQTNAKRQMRYHYHTGGYGVLACAAVLGEKKAARPMLDWIFSSTWEYPMRPAGVQNVMISGHDRAGRFQVGSTHYAKPAWQLVQELLPIKKLGLLPPEYDVTDPKLYPKTLASLDWSIETVMAGRDFPRIADVGGPDKTPWTITSASLLTHAKEGWPATKDPKFARVLFELDKKNEYSESDWQEIEKAAATLPRAPWLDNRSRQVYNWFGALETGLESDNFRDRRAVYIRTGIGYGHHHHDSFDLQLLAFGLPMTVDGGQRRGYSTPQDRSSVVHNVVTADGMPDHFQSWVRHIADGNSARYLSATAATKNADDLFQRSIALIDVESSPWPTSYVVDFFRVRGGSKHTYQFHGAISDEVTSNLNFTPVEEETADAAVLRKFKESTESWQAAPVVGDLQVTWRYQQQVEGYGAGEQEMLDTHYKEGEPRKFTRVHLPATGELSGARAYLADSVCTRMDYRIKQMLVRRAENETDSLFAAVIEPFAGKPTIKQVERLDLGKDAAAVHVTLENGRQDWTVYSDDFSATQTGGPVRMTGEFAIVSHDDKSITNALLVRGTKLEAHGLTIELPKAEYRARIIDIDYPERTLTLDKALPTTAAGEVVEIECGPRTTSATVAKAHGKQVVMKLGATFFRSMITNISENDAVVTCNLAPSLQTTQGLCENLIATNDDGSLQWRADYVGNYDWKLSSMDGESTLQVDSKLFKPTNALRIWEYGKGDSLRLSSWVSIQRTDTGWELTGNADCIVTLPDGNTHTLTAKQFAENNGRIVVER